MAETEAERIEREKREKEQQQSTLSSMLDWLNPFSGGFSLGGLFQMFAIAVVGYFIAKSDAVQGWIGGFFDENGKPGSGKEKVKGWMDKLTKGLMDMLPAGVKEHFDVTDEIRNASESDIDTKLKDLPPALQALFKKNFATLRELAIEANGGAVNGAQLDTFLTNDKTLFALITKQPQLTGDMLAAIKADMGNASSTTSEDGKKKIGQVVESIKAIIGDGRLDEMLNASNRKNTIDIMLKMGGAEKGLAAPMLEKLFTEDMAKNGGKASAGLREMLCGLIDSAISGAPAQPLSAEAKTVVADLGFEAAASKLGTKNRPALENLKTNMGQAGFENLMAALGSGDTPTITVACLQSKNIRATIAFAKSVDAATLPVEFKAPLQIMAGITIGSPYQKALSAVADKNINPLDIRTAFTVVDAHNKPQPLTATGFFSRLLKPGVQQLVEAAGVDNVATIMAANIPDPKLKPVITAANLKTLNQFATNIHNIKMPNGGVDTNNIATVTGALMELAVNQNGQPMQQHAEMIATYFRGNQFSGAFKTMLDGLKIDGKQALLTAMSKEWGTRDDGFLEILASAADVKRLPDLTTGKESLDWYSPEVFLGRTKLGENAAHLKAVKDAIDLPNGSNVTPKNTDRVAFNDPSLYLP